MTKQAGIIGAVSIDTRLKWLRMDCKWWIWKKIFVEYKDGVIWIILLGEVGETERSGMILDLQLFWVMIVLECDTESGGWNNILKKILKVEELKKFGPAVWMG